MRTQPEPSPARKGRRGLAGAIAVVLATALALPVLSTPEPAQAQAARVEATTRPDFGLLLDPPPQRRRPVERRTWRHRDRFNPEWHRPPLSAWSRDVALVDCSLHRDPEILNAAIRYLRPGGTLVLRSGAEGCVGWLNLDKSIVVIGEGSVRIDGFDSHAPVSFRPQDGLPCVTVAAGVRAEFRDIVFHAPYAGDAACIVSYGGQVLMERSVIHYSGNDAAIFAQGGQIDLRDTLIVAETYGAGIVAQEALLQTDDLWLTGASIGIEITAGAGSDNELHGLRMRGVGRPEGYTRRTTGVLVQSERAVGQVRLIEPIICGYSEGLVIDGGSLHMHGGALCEARRGAFVFNGNLRIEHAFIQADDVGVLVDDGDATVIQTGFIGGRLPEDQIADYGGQVEFDQVRFYDYCRPQRLVLNFRDGRHRLPPTGEVRFLRTPRDGDPVCVYGREAAEAIYRFNDLVEDVASRPYVPESDLWSDYDVWWANGGAFGGVYDTAGRYYPIRTREDQRALERAIRDARRSHEREIGEICLSFGGDQRWREYCISRRGF